MDSDRQDRTAAVDAETAEYLRLRCGMLDLIDAEMYGHGLAAGAACGAAEEAYAAARRPEWVRCIVLGVLARRDAAALARRTEELAEAERWLAEASLPTALREWTERDLRRARRAAGAS